MLFNLVKRLNILKLLWSDNGILVDGGKKIVQGAD